MRKDRESERHLNQVGEETLRSDDLIQEEEHHPRGTLAFVMIFLVLLITFWGYVYTLLLLRG